MTDAGVLTGIVGPSLAAFLGVVVVLGGGTAWITGQALAANWRPLWQVIVYCLLLAAAARFLLFALFGGILVSLPGYVVTSLVMLFFGIVSFRSNRARKMVGQYPWLYQRRGLFGWSERPPESPDVPMPPG
ncbi:MAG: hypothetical protein U1E66_09755 [Rhodospirillales bacterium]